MKKESLSVAKLGSGWILGAVMVSLVAAGSLCPPAYGADYKMEAEQLVEKSRFSFESIMADKNMEAFHDIVRRGKGIFIAPQVLEGAFIFGASGGSGVFLAWDGQTRKWNGPAFYRIGGASFGLQIGGQASEVILLAMTDRGVSSLLASSVKLGGDVGIAVGPVGAGASAATANLSADILSFARAKGLYGGISLDGAVVAIRHSLNDAYYGRKLDVPDIIVKGEGKNPQAERLVDAVHKATGK